VRDVQPAPFAVWDLRIVRAEADTMVWLRVKALRGADRNDWSVQFAACRRKSITCLWATISASRVIYDSATYGRANA